MTHTMDKLFGCCDVWLQTEVDRYKIEVRYAFAEKKRKTCCYTGRY